MFILIFPLQKLSMQLGTWIIVIRSQFLYHYIILMFCVSVTTWMCHHGNSNSIFSCLSKTHLITFFLFLNSPPPILPDPLKMLSSPLPTSWAGFEPASSNVNIPLPAMSGARKAHMIKAHSFKLQYLQKEFVLVWLAKWHLLPFYQIGFSPGNVSGVCMWSTLICYVLCFF